MLWAGALMQSGAAAGSGQWVVHGAPAGCRHNALLSQANYIYFEHTCHAHMVQLESVYSEGIYPAGAGQGTPTLRFYTP